MMRRLMVWSAMLFCIVTVDQICAIDYAWFTDEEETIWGETVRFTTGDTLWGPVKSNDMIHISGSPVFYSEVITSSWDFGRGVGFDPQFLGPPPVFNAAASVLNIEFVDQIREWAAAQGNYHDRENTEYLLDFQGNHAILWYWEEGTFFDESNANSEPINLDNTIVFVGRKLSVKGILNGEILVGCSENIYLLDNIRYNCCESEHCDSIPPWCDDFLTLVTNKDIIIANTWANGRDNSGGSGQNQTNPDSTSIVITAMLAAMDTLGGSFTFEQQNDAGDSYQGPSPDRRGTIYLNGGIVQKNRGYVLRSNHGGTGYKLNLRNDTRIGGMFYQNWIFEGWSPNALVITPTELDFSEVAVGDTAWLEIRVEDNPGPAHVDSFSLDSPFFVDSVVEIAYGENFIVAFAPTQVRHYHEQLQFFFPMFWLGAWIDGDGIPPLSIDEQNPLPKSFQFVAYPNPFNPATTIGFDLRTAANVRLAVYDLQGRIVETLINGFLSAGSHDLTFDGANLTSGVYFAVLQAGLQTYSTKLLLLK